MFGKTCSRLAGVFKASKLWKVHLEGSAGGADAASVEVSPPPPGKPLFLPSRSELFTL